MPKQTVTGRLTNITRLVSSSQGNPRFEVTLDGVKIYATIVDGSVGYSVENHRVGRLVTLTLTKSGLVEDMNYLNP
jgi:hypothetical protein